MHVGVGSVTATSSWRAWLMPALSRSALPRLTGSRITRQRDHLRSPRAPRPPWRRWSHRRGRSPRALDSRRRLRPRRWSRSRFLVVGGNQHRHSGPALRQAPPRLPLVEETEDESSGDPGRSGAHRPERDERQQQLSQLSTCRFSFLTRATRNRASVDQRDKERRDGYDQAQRDRPGVLEVPRARRRVRRARGADRPPRRRSRPNAKPGAAARGEPTRSRGPGAWVARSCQFRRPATVSPPGSTRPRSPSRDELPATTS